MARSKINVFIDGEVLVMPHFSGIGHYTYELVCAMDKLLSLPQYHNLNVALFVHFRQVDKARSLGLENIKVIRSPFSLRIANGLKIRAKQPPLDLLFGRGIYIFPNYSSWPLATSRSISFVYDLSYEKYPEFAEPRNQEFLSDQVKKSVRRASHIATISKNSAHEIAEFYDVDEKSIGIYYPAVDTNHFYKRSEQEILAARKRYALPKDYILFVGNIEPRKNLKNLLLSYENLSSDLQDKYPLVLVGSKGWRDGEIFEIISRLKNNGGKIFLPNSYVTDDDMPAIYSGASVFIYPSIYEGFGIPPVEAMACGTPVITSDNSSLPEAVGDAALQVDASSLSEIAHAIKIVLSSTDLQRKLIKKGYDQVERFSWRQSAEKLIKTIEEM